VIWASGLLASAITGAGVGGLMNRDIGTFLGLIAGLCAFACIRLWMKEPPQNSN